MADLQRRQVTGTLRSGWTYTMQLRLDDGRWVPSALSVVPTNAMPSGGLTAREVRKISFTYSTSPIGSLSTAAAKIAREYRGKASYKRGRDCDLARLALVYVDLLQHSRRPVADCAERLGLSHAWVRDAIRQARVRKLLTGSRGQGAAGGDLTPAALALAQGQ